jgi:hypothetical protein
MIMKHLVTTILILSSLGIIPVGESPLIYAQDMADEIQRRYHDVNSEIARANTQVLRAAQQSVTTADNGEEIAFTLASGVDVQFANGTGRRLLIAGDPNYFFLLYPTWSLNGKMLACVAQLVDDSEASLVVANADGSNPTVILTLDIGHTLNIIQSLSWSWDSRFIMFTYALNHVAIGNLFMVCAIEKTGKNFVIGQGVDRAYCQYEPAANSKRYAYVARGFSNLPVSTLQVSNLEAPQGEIWSANLGKLVGQGYIPGYSYMAWNNPNSIYIIARNLRDYPGREVLQRIDKTSAGDTQISNIGISDSLAILMSPTPSPDRKQLYVAEFVATSMMYLIDAEGINVEAKGVGFYPNWRQQIPRTNNQKLAEPVIATLGQNYPNPFNAATTIHFSLLQHARVTLKIFNVQGAEVATLIDGEVEPGSHTTLFDAKDLTSGVYFYRLQAGTLIRNKKLILAK